MVHGADWQVLYVRVYFFICRLGFCLVSFALFILHEFLGSFCRRTDIVPGITARLAKLRLHCTPKHSEYFR